MELVLLTVSLASACANELGGSTSFTEPQQLYNGLSANSYVVEDHNLLDELETPNSASKDQLMVDGRLAIADKPNNPAYPEVDDMAILFGRSRWCRSKDGKCRSDKFRCPHKYQESPYGRPYCTSRKRRCCYTGLPAPTTPTIVTTTKYTTPLATKKPVIKTTTLTTAIPTTTTTKTTTTTTTTTTKPTTTTVDAICPYGFELLDQQCIKISESKATWRKAKDNCADIKHNSWKFQLIVVKDPQGLKEKITNLKKITDNFWVGASSLDNDFFSWVSGKKVNSSFPWGKDDNGVQQPKGKEEDCMILRYFQKQKLYHYVDNRCGKMQRYVCEAIKGCITEGSECSVIVGSETFRVLMTKRSWDECKGDCSSRGLSMAEPADPQALADYLNTNTAGWRYWLGAKGQCTGTPAQCKADTRPFKWKSGATIPWTAPWYGTPQTSSKSYAVMLRAYEVGKPPLMALAPHAPGYCICQ